jgi:hypothetical protein
MQWIRDILSFGWKQIILDAKATPDHQGDLVRTVYRILGFDAQYSNAGREDTYEPAHLYRYGVL